MISIFPINQDSRFTSRAGQISQVILKEIQLGSPISSFLNSPSWCSYQRRREDVHESIWSQHNNFTWGIVVERGVRFRHFNFASFASLLLNCPNSISFISLCQWRCDEIVNADVHCDDFLHVPKMAIAPLAAYAFRGCTGISMSGAVGSIEVPHGYYIPRRNEHKMPLKFDYDINCNAFL